MNVAEGFKDALNLLYVDNLRAQEHKRLKL